MPETRPFYDEGLHVGEIISHQLTKARTGTNQLVIRVKILGVPNEQNYIPHAYQYERSIFWSLTEKTVPFVVDKLKRLHFEGHPSQLDPSSSDPISLKGHQVDLWCSHEPGLNGGIRERWDVAGQMSIAQRAITPLSSKEMRELDMLFGKAFSSPNKERAAAPTLTMNNPEITDDDIPF